MKRIQLALIGLAFTVMLKSGVAQEPKYPPFSEYLMPQDDEIALAKSALLCSEMLAEALCRADGRVRQFRRDGWARAWAPSPAMFGYMIMHDAHHRGQICMLAHQLGFPLPGEASYGLWAWEKLWKECGFSGSTLKMSKSEVKRK